MVRTGVNPIAWPTNHPRKIMIKFLFGVKGIAFIDAFPENVKLDSEYFRENIIKKLILIIYPTGRKSHQIRIWLYFHNAFVHNMRIIA
jgi:hypothetical protein